MRKKNNEKTKFDISRAHPWPWASVAPQQHALAGQRRAFSSKGDF